MRQPECTEHHKEWDRHNQPNRERSRTKSIDMDRVVAKRSRSRPKEVAQEAEIWREENQKCAPPRHGVVPVQEERDADREDDESLNALPQDSSDHSWRSFGHDGSPGGESSKRAEPEDRSGVRNNTRKHRPQVTVEKRWKWYPQP